HEVMDDKFVEDFLSESAKLDQQRAAIQALRNKRDPLSKYQYQKAAAELKKMETAFQKRFFAGVDMNNASAVAAHEVKIGRAIEESNERKIDTVAQMRDVVTKVKEDLDALITQYQAQTDPEKADLLWDRLKRTHKRYNEMAADFNLRNSDLSGLAGTPLFAAMNPADDMAKAIVRSDGALRTENIKLLDTPTTSAEKKATAKAAKAEAKKECERSIEILKEAVKEIPDRFRPIDTADNPAPNTSKSEIDREKQWNKLLKSFRDESRKYVRHERGDALGSVYKIACEVGGKWRNRDNYDALTVIEKQQYQEDKQRLLHDHDGFAWKVLGANGIDAQDYSISELYQVISRAEFKNTLCESRRQALGGVAYMFASIPSGLYYSSMTLVAGVVPRVGDAHWFITAGLEQQTVDSLSRRTAKGLNIARRQDYTSAA
ncbi:MAG: hypothetical protein ACM3JF_02585, partial [Sphaerimonospora mesophila]